MNDVAKGKLIWYGLCTYWTDDWDNLNLKESQGIPSCPECENPGFQMTVQEWNEGIEKYEADGNPGYGECIAELKEKCHGKTTILELWEIKKGVLAEGSPEGEC